VDVAIPANDDSTRAINLILNELSDAVAIGKTMVSARREPRERPKRVRSRRPALARADAAKAETAPTPAVEEEQEQGVKSGSQGGGTEQQKPEQSTS
jgi:ribosomal protein S2